MRELLASLTRLVRPDCLVVVDQLAVLPCLGVTTTNTYLLAHQLALHCSNTPGCRLVLRLHSDPACPASSRAGNLTTRLADLLLRHAVETSRELLKSKTHYNKCPTQSMFATCVRQCAGTGDWAEQGGERRAGGGGQDR